MMAIENKGKVFFGYNFLHPMRESYVDDGSRDLASISMRHDGKDFVFTLVGSVNSIEMIRTTYPDPSGTLGDEDVKFINRVRDHIVATLRLTVDPYANHGSFAGPEGAISVGAFSDDEGRPNLRIDISEIRPPVTTEDIEAATRVAFETFEIRHIVRLLSDAGYNPIPSSYRYLAYYKILEDEFLSSGKWRGFAEFLTLYEERFRNLDLTARSLENFVHELRDKCAHLRLKTTEGVVGLGTNDARLVEGFLPLMRQIVKDRLNDTYAQLGLRIT
jgi:hypothetical protein